MLVAHALRSNADATLSCLQIKADMEATAQRRAQTLNYQPSFTPQAEAKSAEKAPEAKGAEKAPRVCLKSDSGGNVLQELL